MKNYKNLVPIVLIVLFAVGIYMKYDTNASKIEEYNTYVADARSYRDMGINVDAEKNYLAAIALEPSIELYVEVGEFYEQVGAASAVKWGEKTIQVYPEEVSGYEFIMRVYKELGKHADFFDTYSTFTKRGLASKTIDGYVQELNKAFFYDGKYDDASYFAGGLCAVKDDEYWLYVNETGDKVTGKNFNTAGFFFDEVAPIADKLNDIYYINSNGAKKYIIQNVENLVTLGCYDDGLCTIFDGSTWGVYTLEGELKFGGYSNISSLSNGVIAVEKDGKWLLLNTAGEQVISETFDDIKQDEKGIVYRNSRLFVKNDDVYYMIDVEGNKISDQEYEDVKIFYGTGYAAVKIKGKWGFINENGEMKIEPQYEDARSFSNGFAAVKDGGYWGFIDESGEIYLECQFADVRDFTTRGSAFVQISGDWRMLRLYMYNY